MWTDTRFEISGGSVVLFCRANGHPKPVIYWTDSDNNILNDNQTLVVIIFKSVLYTVDNHFFFQTLPNGDLLIKNIDWTMMGIFRCVAANDHGIDSEEGFLYPTSVSVRMLLCSTNPE